MTKSTRKNENSSIKDFLKKILGFSMSSYLGALVTFIASFLNTRLFETDTMGRISLFFTVQSCFLYVAYLGADQSYCRYYYECKTEKEKKQLFDRCFALSMAASLLISVVILLTWKKLSMYIGGIESIWIAIALIVSVIAQMAWRYLSLLQRMKQQIILYTILMLLNTLTNKLSYTVTSFVSKDYRFCLVVMAISSLLVTVAFAGIEGEEIGYISLKIDAKSELTKRIVRFGVPLMPVSLLSWLNSSLPTLLMENMISYDAIGIYSNAVILSSTINLLQSGFTTFWMPYYYENYKTGNKKIKKIHNVICFLMVAFGIGLMLIKDLLFLIVGESYRSGNIVFSLLLISPICYTIGETTGIGISISEKSYLHVFTYASGIIFNIVGCLTLMPIFGIVGAGLAVAMSAIVSLVVKTILGEKYYKCIDSYYKTFGSIALLVGASIWDCLISEKNIIVWTLGLCIFIAVLLVMYKEEVQYCCSIVKNIIIEKRQKQ